MGNAIPEASTFFLSKNTNITADYQVFFYCIFLRSCVGCWRKILKLWIEFWLSYSHVARALLSKRHSKFDKEQLS